MMKALCVVVAVAAVFTICSNNCAWGSDDGAVIDPTCQFVVDPYNVTRIGSDFQWIAMDISAIEEDCIELCCGNPKCQAWSFNTETRYCTDAPNNASVCCALKDAIPSPQHSSFPIGAVSTGYKVIPPATVPKPTDEQLKYMDMGFTMFLHFSVTTFGDNVEHDCVNSKCLPPSLFNPTEMGPDENGISATDQWALTAKAMGAGQICATAHHEGGFCLWPSKYSNYTVMQSGYQRDIIRDFVESCAKYDIEPCFYIGPNANGYFTQVLNYTNDEFYDAQMGMIKEVLTNYGFINRLWWDHYLQPCGNLAECPQCTNASDPKCFPQAWEGFTDFVRSISPKTILGTGPDVGHSGGGETGVGDYPVWNAVNGSSSAYGPLGNLFHPREADATIQNPGDAWFYHEGHPYWNASQVWNHFLLTYGRGENFILNMPPTKTGRIYEGHVDVAQKFGNAFRTTFGTSFGHVSNINTTCNNTIVVHVANNEMVDAIYTSENLMEGQSISSYAIDALVDNQWVQQQIKNGQTVGIRVIDVLDEPIVTSAIRFRCLSSVQDTIHIQSISVHKTYPPMD
eukprot:m.117021 g.117021  ORF g.117021 m.117021 type:complete len:568 (-) comp9316_c0_seq1:420-2123(-)